MARVKLSDVYWTAQATLTQAQMQVNALYITQYFREQDSIVWTFNAIAGMLSFMQGESTINPNLRQFSPNPDGSYGFGLVQWTPESKYINWAESVSTDNYHSMRPQCYRILSERRSPQTYPQYSETVARSWNYLHPGASENQFPETFKDFALSTKKPRDLAEAFYHCYGMQSTSSESRKEEHLSSAQSWYNYISANYTAPETPDPPAPDPTPDPGTAKTGVPDSYTTNVTGGGAKGSPVSQKGSEHFGFAIADGTDSTNYVSRQFWEVNIVDTSDLTKLMSNIGNFTKSGGNPVQGIVGVHQLPIQQTLIKGRYFSGGGVPGETHNEDAWVWNCGGYNISATTLAGGKSSRSYFMSRKLIADRLVIYDGRTGNGAKTTIHVPHKFNSYLDYSPYTSASLYIPYIGEVPINVDLIMGKDVVIEWVFDVVTGDFVAELSVDDRIIGHYTGNCLISTPLDISNWTSSEVARIQRSASIAQFAVSAGGAVASGPSSLLFLAGNALSLQSQIAQYSMSIDKPNLQHISSLSGNGFLGEYKPYIMVCYPQYACASDSAAYSSGLSTTYSGTLRTLSNPQTGRVGGGFIRCKSINLNNLVSGLGSLSTTCTPKQWELDAIQSWFREGFHNNLYLTDAVEATYIYPQAGTLSPDSLYTVEFLNCYTPKDYFAKNYDTVLTTEVRFKDANDLLKPVMILQGDLPSFNKCNYVHIKQLHRFYHITSIRTVAQKTIEVSLEEDVIRTWSKPLLDCTMDIDSSESLWNAWIPDSNVHPIKGSTPYTFFGDTSPFWNANSSIPYITTYIFVTVSSGHVPEFG